MSKYVIEISQEKEELRRVYSFSKSCGTDFIIFDSFVLNVSSILDCADDFHTVDGCRLHRIFCGLQQFNVLKSFPLQRFMEISILTANDKKPLKSVISEAFSYSLFIAAQSLKRRNLNTTVEARIEKTSNCDKIGRRTGFLRRYTGTGG